MMQVNQQPVSYIEQQLLANQMAQAQGIRVQGQGQPQVIPVASTKTPSQVSFGIPNGRDQPQGAVGMSSTDLSLGKDLSLWQCLLSM